MHLGDKITLGETGIRTCRLGISSSYGAPAVAFEEAFERGCTYFNWGTFIKGRSGAMKQAIRAIIAKGQRADLALGVLTYAHSTLLTEAFLRRGLKALGTDYVDILLLGYFSQRPAQRILDGAYGLKERGIVRHLGITTHNRKLLPTLANEGIFDLFHVRYNAVHRGAEVDVFPRIIGDPKPGVVTFTATCWRKLLSTKRMPAGETAPSAADCYRFVLSHPAVDLCLMGAKDAAQMRANLEVLDTDVMSEEELTRMRKIGDHIYGRPRES